MRREKINTSLKIPLTANFSDFAPNSSKMLVLHSIYHLDHDSKHNAKYQLYGISHHSGTLYGGHYIGEA